MNRLFRELKRIRSMPLQPTSGHALMPSASFIVMGALLLAMTGAAIMANVTGAVWHFSAGQICVAAVLGIINLVLAWISLEVITRLR